MSTTLSARSIAWPPAGPGRGSGEAAGGSALDPEVVARLLDSARDEGPLATLTVREREVLELVAEGRSNSAIGERLAVTERAVKKHVTSIFAKLELPPDEDDNRRILAVLAYLRPDRADTATT